jgi:NADH dehydrogenase
VKLGVKVICNASVKEINEAKIFFSDGDSIESGITIWAAGVMGEPTIKKLSLPIEANRVAVEPTLQVQNYPHIWAIGDISGVKNKSGKFLPMVAPVAMQQGRFVAKQIAALIAGRTLKNFSYVDKGSMATIGRHKAVVEVKGIKIGGAIAWFIWLWLHLFYLLGGRNKIGTIADWTWNYLTFDRGNRHIMDSY